MAVEKTGVEAGQVAVIGEIIGAINIHLPVTRCRWWIPDVGVEVISGESRGTLGEKDQAGRFLNRRDIRKITALAGIGAARRQITVERVRSCLNNG